MPRTPEEIIAQIEEQLGFLRRSGAAFDAGDLSKAKRIATTVCVLVDDRGRRVRSVLTLAGVLSIQSFLASGRPVDPRNPLSDMPLVFTRVTVGGGELARAQYLP